LALTYRAAARLGLQEFDGALKDCRRALQMRPDLYEAKDVMSRAQLGRKSRAEWRLEPHPAVMIAPFLDLYGFYASDGRSWLSSCVEAGANSSASVLQCSLQKHSQAGGHTWYTIDCVLSYPTSANREPLQWSVRRRLLQLREHLHDVLKDDLGDENYADAFANAPFVMKGGLMPGTVARLASWLEACARCISLRKPSPSAVAQALQVLDAPDPPLVWSEDLDDTNAEGAKGATASLDDATEPMLMWRPRGRPGSGIAERQLAKPLVKDAVETDGDRSSRTP